MPSLLYKRFPEVLFDCPRRLDPGCDCPVTLIINDLLGSPVGIQDITIAVNQVGTAVKLFKFQATDLHECDHDFSHNQKVYLITLKRKDLPSGTFFINCKASISHKKRTLNILNDNFFSSTKAPLICHASTEKLPGHEFCSYGDMHFHSQYSQSHVEFGPPLEAVDSTAQVSGLDFAAITDHSYDLACSMDNYLTEDPWLYRWQSFRKQVNATK